MASWMESVGYIASEPARVAVMVALVQSERPLEEMSIAQMAGLLHQRITGTPLETAVLMRHIRDLAERGLLERDESGFRWQMTSLGVLVSRQWASGTLEPDGTAPLAEGEVRAWRDRLIDQMEQDANLADEAEIEREELLAGQGPRLAELRVLNRVLGDNRLPDWLQEMAGGSDDEE
ncbi:MAG TPA: hypothetical protein VFV93_10390 [Thermomicrobiales bacterium]|nr:hypothetical protein [Thermomicrobiales bacterium]